MLPSGETDWKPSKPALNVSWRASVPSGFIDQMWMNGAQLESK